MKITVDLGAYRRNLRSLRARLAPSDIMAVVKDDAYGHGRDRMVEVAREEGIRRFAVLDTTTGLALRQRGIPADTVLLAWLLDPEEDFGPAISQVIDLGVSNVDVLDRVADAASRVGGSARVHLKIDSGLHRNGANPADWPRLVSRAREYEQTGVINVSGLWTHIGEASDDDDNASQAVFDDALRIAVNAGIHPEMRHLAASAASLARPEFRYDVCRVGGFTFGIAPGSGVAPIDLDLEPVMRVTATVTSKTTKNAREVMSLDAGYLDGLPAWGLPPAAEESTGLPRRGFDVTREGQRLPILHVGPSETVVAPGALAREIRIGDEVVLFGSHLRSEPVLQEWADATGTVGEEIVVRVGRCATRTYVDDHTSHA